MLFDTIKMSVLPKILFLFQNLPMKTSFALINDLDKQIRRFIWQNKKVRIKQKYLQNKKENGGLVFPSLKLYYQAVALTWMRNQFLLSDLDMLSLEGHDLPYGWHSYLWSDGKVPKTFTSHFLRNLLIKTWITCRSLLYKSIPLQVSPLEAISSISSSNDFFHTYFVLLNQDCSLKIPSQLQQINIVLDWWRYNQLQSRYLANKKPNIFFLITIFMQAIKDY